MDPITGLAALTGISLASLAALRLKQGSQEGFAILPNTAERYPSSVLESQSRYNQLTNMVNPLVNGIIPVGSPNSLVNSQRNLVRQALGGTDARALLKRSTVLNTNFKHTLIPRADNDKSIFGAMKFCRSAAQQQQPFSLLNEDGSPAEGKGAATSKDGMWNFDEVCGICLTGGIDEEGRSFKGRRGMLLDPETRDVAVGEAVTKGYPFIRAAPTIGSCNGSPGEPSFATNQKDLIRFQKRLECMKRKQIDSKHSCGLCYENDVFSYVEKDAETNEMSLVLQGVGVIVVKLRSSEIAKLTLSDTKSVTIPLTDAKEEDPFSISVSPDPAIPSKPASLYGYFQGINATNGMFTMPLNLLTTVDDETGGVPNKAGGFYRFTGVNLEVAKMRPATGKKNMRLRGILPFTFVSGSEFSAIDCPAAPYQTSAKSVSAFATDQPCFSKGSKAGNYSEACLQGRILDAGCTNAGTLFKNPKQLNTKNGVAQNLSDIYSTLETIKDNDMIDPEMTKQCSGRQIATPCDPFIARPEIRIGEILQSNNTILKNSARQCLSYLYHNRGANELGPTPRVGPTYSGLITYTNNQKERKNIVCLPEGTLNPDRNQDAVKTLSMIADQGFRGKTGVEGVRTYLNAQLEMAVDMTRNANTDPDRKSAIQNCFGQNLKALPTSSNTVPTVIEDPCGVVARYVNVYGATNKADGYLEISQIVVIDKDGNNVALNKNTAGSSPSYWPHGFGTHEAAFAVDGKIWAKQKDFYISQQTGAKAVFKLDLGKDFDITRIIYITRGNANQTCRKQGARIELFNTKNIKVAERTLQTCDIREDIMFLNEGAKSTCKSVPPPPPMAVIPTGFSSGLYVSFFTVTSERPSTTVGSTGWGQRLQAQAYTRLNIGDKTSNTLDKLPKEDAVGFVAKGYYFAATPGRLQLATLSDDGVRVRFNNQTVIDDWNIHAPSWKETAFIDIPNAGKYPIEIIFYEWYGGAVCNLYFKTEQDTDWKYDMAGRFAYSLTEAQADNQAYQAAQDAKALDEQRRIAASQQLGSRAELYGPWISGTNGNKVKQVEKTALLPNGELVFMIYENPYTKMVPRAGGGRYYIGTLDKFDPSKFNTYVWAGNNYLLRLR